MVEYFYISDFFQYDGVMYCIFGIFVLCKWVVGMDQNVGYLCCIDILFFKGFYDDVIGFLFIFVVDFCVGYFVGVGNGVVEIVGVGGVGCWN